MCARARVALSLTASHTRARAGTHTFILLFSVCGFLRGRCGARTATKA